MIYPVVFELAAGGIPVAVACRVLGASTSGYYDWRDRPPSPRAVADAALSETITAAHRASHGTYGSRRLHAELRLGQDIWVGRKRVERLMRCAGLQGVSRRRLRGCTRRDPTATPPEDLVQRNFTVEGPNKLWCADVTQHRTGEGWLYLAVVLDAYSRRVVGWAMADHLRAELVVDALQMALWQRREHILTVGVHDRIDLTAQGHGVAQRHDGQVGGHPVGDEVTDDPLGARVGDRAEVDLALAGGVLGDVGQPGDVRCGRGELTVDQVVVHRRAGLAVQPALLGR